jgi:hypothetical protein
MIFHVYNYVPENIKNFLWYLGREKNEFTCDALS